jgi:hypothetical protein
MDVPAPSAFGKFVLLTRDGILTGGIRITEDIGRLADIRVQVVMT